jgi:hypothetical protein
MRCFNFLFLLIVLFHQASGQGSTAGKPKMDVYKIAVNDKAQKEGVQGISVVFSCEYHFSDAEYTGMKNGEGKNMFTFYTSLVNKATNETFYNGLNYNQFNKASNTVAMHVSEEHAYEPQNKAQGRRNTGIELFIPYYHLDLPEGTTAVKLYIGAMPGKGTSFERIFSQDISLSKPAASFITIVPRQITITDKAGKKYEAESLEQDFAVAPGNNKGLKDVNASGNISLNVPFSFLYVEGDAVRLKVQKSISKGLVATKKVRALRGRNGQSLTNFDNKAALEGEWVMDPKQKTLTLKNEALQVVADVNRTKVPAVRITDFAVNPHASHEGVAGAMLTFSYNAQAAPNTPPVAAVPVYTTAAGTANFLSGGLVTSGKAEVDSAGAIVLPYHTPGKISIFYPAFNLLLHHPDIRQENPSAFALQVKLHNSEGLITQKQIKQNLPVSVLQDAKVAPVVKAADTIYNNSRGFVIHIPYQLPKLYTDMLPNSLIIQLAEASAKETRGADLLKNMTLINKNVEKLTDASNKKGASFRISKPAGSIDLFMPYTDLNRPEKAPVAFAVKTLIVNNAGSPVEVGSGSSAIRFDLDNKKLRFITLGISNIRLKKADTGDIMWRISSADRVLYQSAMIPAAKSIDNLYTHTFYIHEDDKVIVEMLKGKSAADAKVAMKWEKPVKELTGSEILEIDPGKLPGNTDDGDTRSVTMMYSVQ